MLTGISAISLFIKDRILKSFQETRNKKKEEIIQELKNITYDMKKQKIKSRCELIDFEKIPLEIVKGNNEYLEEVLREDISKSENFIEDFMTNKLSQFYTEKLEKPYKNEAFKNLKYDIPDYLCYSDSLFEKMNKILPKTLQIKKHENIKNSLYEKLSKAFLDLDKCLDMMYIGYSGIKKGLDGEQKTEKTLQYLSGDCKILRNIRLELNGQSSESDIIVVSPDGVFIIEIKNYGSKGDTLNISKDGQWSIFRAKSNKTDPIGDVVAQNYYHCDINNRIINKHLSKLNLPNIKCHSIIAIANDDVTINNETDNIVVRPSNVITALLNFKKSDNLDKCTQEEIVKCIEENKLPPKEYEHETYYRRVRLICKNIYSILVVSYFVNKIVQKFIEGEKL